MIINCITCALEFTCTPTQPTESAVTALRITIFGYGILHKVSLKNPNQIAFGGTQRVDLFHCQCENRSIRTVYTQSLVCMECFNVHNLLWCATHDMLAHFSL